MSERPNQSPEGRKKSLDRRQREAEALRANLLRRKQAQRARAEAAEGDPPPPPVSDDDRAT